MLEQVDLFLQRCSIEKVLKRFGLVQYADSEYKDAASLLDFNYPKLLMS